MKHIVSYSGGLGSAITAKHICDTYGRENVTLLFADTNMEDEDLYRFNKDVVKLLGCEFVSIADGRDVWQVFSDVKFIGNSRIDPCSKILKRQLLEQWIKREYKPDGCIVWIGIDCSEEHRLAPIVRRYIPYNYRSYLIENDVFLTTEYKQQWCNDNSIVIPRLYTMGFAHNNCGGFCVKSGLGQFKKLYENLPDRYKYHEDKELELISLNPKLRPFLKKMVKGVNYYLTLKEYRENYLEPKLVTEEESMEFGGCGCAL